MRKLTQAMVRQFIRTLGGTLKHDIEWQEYVVRFGEDTYHTNDLQDALGTARCMKGSHPNIEQAEENLAAELGHAL